MAGERAMLGARQFEAPLQLRNSSSAAMDSEGDEQQVDWRHVHGSRLYCRHACTRDDIFDDFARELSFLLTNRIPRRWLTLLMGRVSPIEQPLVRSAAIGLWKMFSRSRPAAMRRRASFTSLQDCFIRELKEGARPIDADPAVLVSPCDAIVGACGTIEDGAVVQAKGFPYTLDELLGDAALAAQYEGGQFVTLRITPTMYHRFHAPHDLRRRARHLHLRRHLERVSRSR